MSSDAQQWNKQQMIDPMSAFDEYLKAHPEGRQVHHTGTLGYNEEEWLAFEDAYRRATIATAKRCATSLRKGAALAHSREVANALCGYASMLSNEFGLKED
jgi:hypothetical protein